MRRSRPIQLAIWRQQTALAPGRLSRARLVRSSVDRADQVRPLAHVILVQQTFQRDLHEITIRQISRPIRIGQTRGLGKQVPDLRAIRSPLIWLEPIQQHQHLPHGRRPRRRRPHPANAIPKERRTNGRTLDHTVVRQILHGQRTRPRRTGRIRDNRLGNRACVECISPVGRNVPQCRRQVRLAQQMPFRNRLAVDKKQPLSIRPIDPLGKARQQPGKPWTDLKPLLCKGYRRFEQGRPSKLTMPRMQRFHQPNQARHADGLAAQYAREKGQGLAIFHEHIRRRTRRSSLARIPACQPVRAVNHCESATPNATGLWLDHVQHQQGRNGCIRCRAALAQHRVASLRGQRIGRHDHVMLSGNQRFGRKAGRCLWIRLRLGNRRATDQQAGRQGSKEDAHVGSPIVSSKGCLSFANLTSLYSCSRIRFRKQSPHELAHQYPAATRR